MLKPQPAIRENALRSTEISSLKGSRKLRSISAWPAVASGEVLMCWVVPQYVTRISIAPVAPFKTSGWLRVRKASEWDGSAFSITVPWNGCWEYPSQSKYWRIFVWGMYRTFRHNRIWRLPDGGSGFRWNISFTMSPGAIRWLRARGNGDADYEGLHENRRRGKNQTGGRAASLER